MGEPVDICALLFGGYAKLILLDKLSYMVSVNLPSFSSSMSQLYFILFPLCNGIYFFLLNYPLRIVLIYFSATCVYNIA